MARALTLTLARLADLDQVRGLLGGDDVVHLVRVRARDRVGVRVRVRVG